MRLVGRDKKDSINTSSSEDEPSDTSDHEVAMPSATAANFASSENLSFDNRILNPSYMSESEPDSEITNQFVNSNCMSDDNESCTDIRTVPDIKSKLIFWAAYNNITLKAVTSLLKTLKTFPTIITDSLPTDGRTLLQTPRTISIQKMDDGYYFYFTLKMNLEKLDSEYVDSLAGSTIRISVNIDGLPLLRSSRKSLWPILWRLSDIKNSKVFVAALYYGRSKPNSCTAFLADFVNECKTLIQNGVVISGEKYNFRLHNIIADTPAVSFILDTVGHGAFNSCRRCEVSGFHEKGRVSFFVPLSDMPKLEMRDARCFNSLKYYGTLQKGRTPIMEISHFDPTQDLPYDYLHLICLHLICLGVMRTLVKLWMSSKRCHKNTIYSISYVQTLRISKRLESIRKYCPVEFQRKSRSLLEVPDWKGSEYRQLLLYLGVLVFQDIVDPFVYRHFMLLHYFIRYLCDPNADISRISEIRRLIEKFVNVYSLIYGRHMIVHNVHALLHICDDFNRFGTLDNYSAFPFESFMFQLKKLVRSGCNAFQQVIKRLMEQHVRLFVLKEKKRVLGTVAGEHNSGPLPTFANMALLKQYTRLETEDFTINCKRPADNVVMLKNGNIMRVQNVLKHVESNEVHVLGAVYQSVTSVYTYPADSATTGIYKVTNLHTDVVTLHKADQVSYKCMAIPLKDRKTTIIFRLLHCR